VNCASPAQRQPPSPRRDLANAEAKRSPDWKNEDFIEHVLLELGLCETVLITHGESAAPASGAPAMSSRRRALPDQFEQPYGPLGPPTLFTIPGLRDMKTHGLSHEQLAAIGRTQSSQGRPRRITNLDTTGCPVWILCGVGRRSREPQKSSGQP